MSYSEAEKKKLYKLHNLNKKSLENAIDLIKQNIKNCYIEEVSESNYLINELFTNKKRILLINNIRSYNRILFGLLVSWSDQCIRRLFYEQNVFTETQINFLLDKTRSLEQKWNFALKISFLKANGLIPLGNEKCVKLNINSNFSNSLNSELLKKYDEIQNLINYFLIPSFDIRNKVQHGEWIAAFRPENPETYNAKFTKNIFQENIITISSRIVIFKSVYQMIVGLATFSSNNFKINNSTTPFEYFYSQNIKKINYEKTKISTPNLNKFINDLIEKKENGKLHRQKYKITNC